jgi:hypothetical protein
MKKLSVQEIESIIRSTALTPADQEDILTQIRSHAATQEEDLEGVTTPTSPTRTVTILMGAQEALNAVDTDQLTAFTVQIEAEADHNTLVGHFVQKAREYNANTKRRSSKVYRLGEVFDTLKPKKHLDSFPKKIMTKEASLIIKTTNLNIPQNEAQ